MSLSKYIFDLLQRPLSGLRETKENVNASGEIECGKDEVGLPCDVGETGGDGPREREIEGPVGCGCE